MRYPKTIDPGISDVIEAAGCPLHYWHWGPSSSEVIVLLHGLALDHRSFAEQVRTLSESHRVIALDIRGHGNSQPLGVGFSLARAADDVRVVIDRFNIARVTLIGHSMGGLIAQEFALRHPDRTRSLVLIDTLCLTTPLRLVDHLEFAVVGLLLRMLPLRPLVARLGRRISRQEPVQRYAVEAATRLSRRVLISVWSGLVNSLAAARDESSRVPLLLVVGSHDRFGPVLSRYRRWAERATEGAYTLIPQSGHVPHQDNPRLVNSAILSFLSKLSGSS